MPKWIGKPTRFQMAWGQMTLKEGNVVRESNLVWRTVEETYLHLANIISCRNSCLIAKNKFVCCEPASWGWAWLSGTIYILLDVVLNLNKTCLVTLNYQDYCHALKMCCHLSQCSKTNCPSEIPKQLLKQRTSLINTDHVVGRCARIYQQR